MPQSLKWQHFKSFTAVPAADKPKINVLLTETKQQQPATISFIV